MKQMRKISVVWGICLVLLLVSLTVFGIMFNKSGKIYKEMENKLVESTKKYVEKTFAYPKDDKELKVTYSQLREEKMIDKLSVDNNECDGYVIVKKNELVYNYKGYIKCKDYTTKKYQK